MPKSACKSVPSKSGIDTEIVSEGYYVFIAFQSPKTGETVEIKLRRSSSNALTALLTVCDGAAEDAGTMAVTLRGEMTIRRAESHAAPSAIPATG